MKKTARSLLRLARALMADEISDFMREYQTGGYEYAATFLGKTRPGTRPHNTTKINRLFTEEDARRVMVTVVSVKKTSDMLSVTFVGTAGRTDTYAFTRVPYEQLVTIKPRAPRVFEIAEQVKAKLENLGLGSLGQYHGKVGDHYGIGDKARRIAVGHRDFQLNQFLVSIGNEWEAKRPQQRWNLYKSFLISQVDDNLIQKAVEWVKAGKTMIEVRNSARQQYQDGKEIVVELG